jgi:perosamine synthetase
MKVPYFEPWITKDDKKAMTRILDQRWLTNGPTLHKFEDHFKRFIGTKFALGVSSATHALHLAMRALNIGPRDEVIVPTLTFAATANAVIYNGAKPIFVDVNDQTFTMSPERIKNSISKKTKAIIVVHYGGQACDMTEILNISKKNNIPVIEDCAHSLGSIYKKKFCGALGIIGCFSFYATKIITTAEGGMVSTNDDEIYKKIKLLRSQAMSIQANERERKAQWKYDIVDLGYNYRLDEIRSALGLSQLKRIDKIIKKRIEIASRYNERLKKIRGITIPQVKDDRNHVYHLYTIRVGEEYQLSRDELFKKLSQKGIGTSVQYYPLHLMSYYKNNFKINEGDFPVSNRLKDEVLSLPIFPTMSEEQVDYVIKQIDVK